MPKKELINAIDVGSTLAGGAAGWFLPDLFWDKPTYVQRGSMAGLLGLAALVGSKVTQDAIRKGRKRGGLGTGGDVASGAWQGVKQSIPGVARSQDLDPNSAASVGYKVGQTWNPVSSAGKTLVTGTAGLGAALGDRFILQPYINTHQAQIKQFYKDVDSGKIKPDWSSWQGWKARFAKGNKEPTKFWSYKPTSGWRSTLRGLGLAEAMSVLYSLLAPTPYSGKQE